VTRVSENAPPDIRHLLDNGEFIRRHIACTSDDDIASMLHVIGVENLDELMDAVVPERIRSRAPLDLPDPQPEWDVIDRLCSLAAFNRPRTSLIGMGYTNTVTPAVIRRNLLENPAWYTSYTPYQPEISQGRLESLLNLQSLISDLTGLPIANASLLDEATAAAEAMTMAQRSSRHASTTMFVHDDTHPQTIAVMATRAEPLGISLRIGSPADFDPEDVFAALFSYPTSTGSIADVRLPIDRLHEAGGLAIISTDPLACVLLESPGSRGADIAVGSAQRFGVPLGFGGPHASFMSKTQALARMRPGRLVGVSKDAHDRPALGLALQTREQHIRREKATSNICTAHALLANVAAMYAVWHGPEGLERIAERVHALASMVATHARAIGMELVHPEFFDTVCLNTSVAGMEGRSREIESRFRAANFDIRVVNEDVISMTFDETSDLETVATVCRVLDPNETRSPALDSWASVMSFARRRTDRILTADVFHRHRNEHDMLPYLRRLSDRDLSLSTER